MKRRALMKSLAAGAAILAAPRLAKAEATSVLRFTPLADLAVLDPVFTPARPTRYYQPTAMRADLKGVLKGTPQFHGIARA